MEFDDIKGKNFNGNILIIGWPGSGKSTLSKELKKNHPNHTLIHTDAYMKNGYEQGLYEIMDGIDGMKNTIIEGVQGTRLLRKGVQTGKYLPDVVIHVTAPESSIMKTYKTERTDKDPKFLKGLFRSHDKILKDYKGYRNPNPPVWVDVRNEY